ncbi:MAG: ribose 1,5-bisphosphate isomerase [Candidatus Methanomethylophilaceae archaeon]|nr:ribose 1,5-bisphosphate isomerase [Candidatus Methanomethylophilaceae archaeon]MBR7124615.1 ribose 1,5-bisphosphate isomerase [Candidatus Methanomethylophilaceae archaeon]
MDVDTTVEAIKSMEIRGAGRIARAGASALADYATNFKGDDPKGFIAGIMDSRDRILGSRPTAVSLWNGVHATIKGVDACDTVEGMRELIVSNAERFNKASLDAVKTIGEIGAKRIQDGDVILTHCNSSAALSVIKTAFRQGKKFRVYATESRPWRQGILTVNELAKEGIDITLIIDSAVRSVMKSVTKVFVGADTITSHGTLVNKIGTSQLALAANEARVQFYVCSETYKFSPMTLFGDMVTIEERDHDEVAKREILDPAVKIFNPVFDSTPSKYIDGIITEVGLISPGSVYHVMTDQLGDDIFKLIG